MNKEFKKDDRVEWFQDNDDCKYYGRIIKINKLTFTVLEDCGQKVRVEKSKLNFQCSIQL